MFTFLSHITLLDAHIEFCQDYSNDKQIIIIMRESEISGCKEFEMYVNAFARVQVALLRSSVDIISNK